MSSAPVAAPADDVGMVLSYLLAEQAADTRRADDASLLASGVCSLHGGVHDRPDCARVTAHLSSTLRADACLHRLLRQSISAIRRTFHVYHSLREGGHEVCFSFNGGKDCMALFHLLRACLAQRLCGCDVTLRDVTLAYFNPGREGGATDFPAVTAFISSCEARYGVTVQRYSDTASGMRCLVSRGVRAIFMGTREVDPKGGDACLFDPCSTDYPPLMRVAPVLHWGTGHVWALLRGAGLPYCRLYDEGYTSCGHVQDTAQHPSLRLEEGTFLPAYMLAEIDPSAHERAGRREQAASSSSSVGAATEARI